MERSIITLSKTGIVHYSKFTWWYVLSWRFNKMKEKEDWYEYENLRICEKWLQIESCRRCLLETLCHYEKNNGQKQDPWNNE